MPDLIRISGIEVWARHGVLQSEQETGQNFVVDLDLAIDTTEAGESDQLSDTVDYGDLAQRTHDLVSDTRFDLIETLASRIADMVLKNARIEGVTVTVHKPQAPIAVPFSDVSVTISRQR